MSGTGKALRKRCCNGARWTGRDRGWIRAALWASLPCDRRRRDDKPAAQTWADFPGQELNSGRADDPLADWAPQQAPARVRRRPQQGSTPWPSRARYFRRPRCRQAVTREERDEVHDEGQDDTGCLKILPMWKMVSWPTAPSASRPSPAWNVFTALAVSAPNRPSRIPV